MLGICVACDVGVCVPLTVICDFAAEVCVTVIFDWWFVLAWLCNSVG